MRVPPTNFGELAGAQHGMILPPEYDKKTPQSQTFCFECAYFRNKVRRVCTFTGARLLQQARACHHFERVSPWT